RGLIVWLMPETRRGALLTHGFHLPDELARLKAGQAAAIGVDESRPTATPAPTERTPTLEVRLTDALTENARLRADVDQLRATVVGLQEALGMSSPPPG